MTQDTSGYPPGGGSAVPSSDSPSTTQVARDEAAGVASHAGQAGSQVASTATQQAKEVTAEAKQQATNVAQQGLDQVRTQVQNGKLQAAAGVGGLADSLRGMASGQTQAPGFAQDLVNQAADYVQQAANWLESREPAELLDDVRTFARQRPGLFLAGSAVAGLLVGRLTRGVVASQSDSIDSPRRTAVDTGTSRHALSAPATDHTGADYSTTDYRSTDYATTTTATGGYTSGYTTGGAGYDTGAAAGYGQDSGWQTDPGYTSTTSTGQHESADYDRGAGWETGTSTYGQTTAPAEVDPITGEPRTAGDYGTGGYGSSGQVRP